MHAVLLCVVFLFGAWSGALLSRLVAECSERSVRRWVAEHPPMPLIALKASDEGETHETRTLH